MPLVTVYRTRRLLLTMALAASSLNLNFAVAAPVMGYKVVAKYPHSTDSYTEGFFYLDALFYDGTGLNGHSAIVVTQPKTGKIVRHRDMPSQYFGEGIVDWGPNIIEWTWQSHIGFVLDRLSLTIVREFFYDGEGWGMTRTPNELVTSDGTAILRFRNPDTFYETRHIVVKDGLKIIDELNELEYVRGNIYANVWHSDRIARISPQDGHVIAWIDLKGLLPASQRINSESVLSGIAYDANNDRLFVTGKQWPNVFEIRVLRQTSATNRQALVRSRFPKLRSNTPKTPIDDDRDVESSSADWMTSKLMITRSKTVAL